MENRLILVILALFCYTLPTVADNKTTPNGSVEQAAQMLKRANLLRDSKPDSALWLFQAALPNFRQEEQLNQHIACLLGLADIFKNKGQYSLAYGHLWDALLLVEENATHETKLAQISIYQELGRLYAIYEKHSKALFYFTAALNLAKTSSKHNEANKLKLNNIYYALAVSNRKSRKYRIALAYLDSCQQINQKQKGYTGNNYYIDAQRGIILLHTNKPSEAKNYLEKAHLHFQVHQHAYRSITSSFLGDLYQKQGQWNNAQQHYTNSLNAIDSTRAHTDIKVNVLKKLARICQQLGQTNLAYNYLNQAMVITDSLFNSKTAINNQLFQIQDKHQETIKQKNTFIKEQTLLIEKNEVVQSRLKLLIAFLVFVAVALVILTKMRNKLRKFSAEIQQIETQALFDKNKAEEIMEIKSRELTASTLQIIEKDQTIEELMLHLKEEAPACYQKLNKKVQRGNKDMWEQFNKRFTEVNTSFYDRLRQKHPELSPTEQKHCALIKLNFDSKEMASLLNISVSSVHISRHRIRKKIGLERDDNLGNYIADI